MVRDDPDAMWPDFDGRPIELEPIEPDLALLQQAPTAERPAEAIAARLGL